MPASTRESAEGSGRVGWGWREAEPGNIWLRGSQGSSRG